MRYQIYEAKSVKYDAQQRVGMKIIPLETSELKRIIQVNKTYKELYPIFNEAFNSTLLPHVWCESCIKNCI